MERRWPHGDPGVPAFVASLVNPRCPRCNGTGYVQSGPQPRKRLCSCQGQWEMRTVQTGPDTWEDVFVELVPPEVAPA